VGELTLCKKYRKKLSNQNSCFPVEGLLERRIESLGNEIVFDFLLLKKLVLLLLRVLILEWILEIIIEGIMVLERVKGV
jgi:hypothetical protein